MQALLDIALITHVAAGVIALLVAPLAIIAKKGGMHHKRWGLLFFWSMTVIFITALFLSTFKWIPFLLMISVFSYYAVFSGYRWKFLKRLHRGQQPRWFDWLAAILNALMNIIFVVWGIYLIFLHSIHTLSFLAIGFGTLGLLISFQNIKLFLRPHKAQAWLHRHISGMLGGFIATLTAFSTQVMDFMPVGLQWSWPSLIGIPLIIMFRRSLQRKAGTSNSGLTS